MGKGHVQTYDWVVKLLNDCDFDGAACRLGFDRTADGDLAIDFLGRRYRITKEGIEPPVPKDVRNEVFEFNVRSVLGYYALSDGNCEPLLDFYPLNYFSHGVFSGGAGKSGAEWSTEPLRKAIGGSYKKFCAAAEKLGLAFEETRGEGKYIWSYLLLPKLPVKIAYYEGDDDFPSDVKILYDKTAPLFFKFEPLAVLNACFIHALAGAAVNDENHD
ncbi:MAG: DUF3786 domain-containing protein [Spirochaetaceae bacterium]|jgi:hypothetical protein|nr:DUF3786 domain-containing protein [Spirochaetaceae bacterium]